MAKLFTPGAFTPDAATLKFTPGAECRVVDLRKVDSAGLRWSLPCPVSRVLLVLVDDGSVDAWIDGDRVELIKPAGSECVKAIVEYPKN